MFLALIIFPQTPLQCEAPVFLNLMKVEDAKQMFQY